MQPKAHNPAHMFNRYGHLQPEWYTAIRKRLATVDGPNLQRQCDLLAEQVGAQDRMAIWALLMWNEQPPAGVAEQLQRWADKGMPLRRRL
jgi:hypothetical protein